VSIYCFPMRATWSFCILLELLAIFVRLSVRQVNCETPHYMLYFFTLFYYYISSGFKYFVKVLYIKFYWNSLVVLGSRLANGHSQVATFWSEVAGGRNLMNMCWGGPICVTMSHVVINSCHYRPCHTVATPCGNIRQVT